jgi:hypothetical protein
LPLSVIVSSKSSSSYAIQIDVLFNNVKATALNDVGRGNTSIISLWIAVFIFGDMYNFLVDDGGDNDEEEGGVEEGDDGRLFLVGVVIPTAMAAEGLFVTASSAVEFSPWAA